MVRLYRRRIAKVEYWEAWSDAPANCSCHRGRAGERGVAERIAVTVGGAELETSGLPTEALIVLSAVEDTIHWPFARRGGRFDGP